MLKRFLLLAFILIASPPLQGQQAISPSRVFSTVNGTVTAPVFTWTVEPALGIYRVGSGVIGVSGGVKLQSGSTLTSGIGVPTGGADGDFYFRSDTGDLYRRLSGTWATYGSGTGGTGTVTSVALTLPAIFSISGSPITTSGTLAVSLASQAANVVFASPNGSTGGPSFRKLLFGDWGSNACGAGQIPKYDGSAWQCADDAGASTGAPAAAQYLTLATDATLSNERVLTAGAGISFTDAGAGSTLTVAATGAPATTGALPLFGNGSGGFTNGTVQGNTTKVVTYAGSAPATNDCAKFDASGNVTTAGAACGAGGGGGTPAGSTGDVQYNNAGAFGAVTPTTTGYVLTSNGSGVAPSFQAATGGGGSPYVVQATSSQSTGTAASITSTGITTITGHALIAIVTGETVPGASAIADNSSGTWTRAINTATGDSKVAVYVDPNITGRTGHTVTYTPGSADFISLQVLELASVPTSSIVDTSASAVTSGTSHASGTITSTGNVLLIGAGGTDHGSESTYTVGAGWSLLSSSLGASGSSEGSVVGTRTVAAGVTDQFTWTTGGSFSEGSIVIGIKAAPPTVTPGALIFREAHTASASSSLDFITCIDPAYDHYKLVFDNVVPSGTDILRIQFSTNAGSTYDASGLYQTKSFETVFAVGNTDRGSSSTGGLELRPGATSTTPTNGSWNTELDLWNPGGSLFKVMSGLIPFWAASGSWGVEMWMGWYNNTTPVNAFRVNQSSANTITSGTVRCYAVAH